jgi:hypothetical protein
MDFITANQCVVLISASMQRTVCPSWCLEPASDTQACAIVAQSLHPSSPCQMTARPVEAPGFSAESCPLSRIFPIACCHQCPRWNSRRSVRIRNRRTGQGICPARRRDIVDRRDRSPGRQIAPTSHGFDQCPGAAVDRLRLPGVSPRCRYNDRWPAYPRICTLTFIWAETVQEGAAICQFFLPMKNATIILYVNTAIDAGSVRNRL